MHRVRRHLCSCSAHALISIILAIMVIIYATLYSGVARHVTLKMNYNPSEFYVESYSIDKDSFDVTGFFYNKIKQSNDTHRSLLKLFGIADFIKQLRHGRRKPLSDGRVFDVGRSVDTVNCQALLDGDKAEIDYAKTLYENSTLPSIQPSEYVNMTRSCSKFTSERNYIMDPLTEEERDFSIAFSILMYKDVEQFERLLRAIYRPQHCYCVHVDLGAEERVYEAVAAIVTCFPNVYVAQPRSKVKWGEMSVLEPELVCMRLLHERHKLWRYFINLTGQEFPLRTNLELIRVLEAYKGANDVEGLRLRANKERWKGRGDPPHGIIPTKGAVHVVLCRGFVDYILHNQTAHDFLEWVKKTEIPDETFFASLNANPHLKVPGSYTGVLETNTTNKAYMARYKNWGDTPCGGTFLRGICILGVTDLPRLAQQRALFANKFVWTHERAAQECLEQILYNRTRDEFFGKLDVDVSWYEKLDFVNNHI